MVPLNVIYLRFICQYILFSLDLHFTVTVSLQSGISILIKKSSFATVICPFMEKKRMLLCETINYHARE